MARAAAAAGVGVDDDGQALVELALVLPVLLAVSFAVVLVAEVGVARLALQHAVSEAARAGALTNDDDEIRRTLAAAVSPLHAGDVAIDVEPAADRPPRSADPRGSLLRVSARYTVALPLAFVGLQGITLRATSARRMEWTP